MPPIHPEFYARCQHEMPEILCAEKWIKEYASTHNIPVIGDFNPIALGLDSSKFHDGMHCRYEDINKIVLTQLRELGIEQ
jgi:hypothetical protein